MSCSKKIVIESESILYSKSDLINPGYGRFGYKLTLLSKDFGRGVYQSKRITMLLCEKKVFDRENSSK